MKTVAIIMSRWHSTRLPGKALADLCSKPLLQHVIDRTREAKLVDEVVVATTINSQPIIDYCEANNIPYYVGSEDDILDRVYKAGIKFKADVVVRLWGDCPLISPKQIDKAIELFDGHYVTVGSEFGIVAVTSFREIKDAWLNISNTEHRHWIHKYLSRVLYSVDTQGDLDRIEKYVSQGNN